MGGGGLPGVGAEDRCETVEETVRIVGEMRQRGAEGTVRLTGQDV